MGRKAGFVYQERQGPEGAHGSDEKEEKAKSFQIGKLGRELDDLREQLNEGEEEDNAEQAMLDEIADMKSQTQTFEEDVETVDSQLVEEQAELAQLVSDIQPPIALCAVCAVGDACANRHLFAFWWLDHITASRQQQALAAAEQASEKFRAEAEAKQDNSAEDYTKVEMLGKRLDKLHRTKKNELPKHREKRVSLNTAEKEMETLRKEAVRRMRCVCFTPG